MMYDRLLQSWACFTAAPHRMLFFGGSVALVLSVVWWGLVLASWTGLLLSPPAITPPIHTHAWLMVYGIFPFYVLGFLMTAFVRWIGAPPLPRRLYLPVALGMFAGYLLVLIGTLFSMNMVAVGMAATALAWFSGLLALGHRLRAHPSTTSPHPRWALGLLAIGWLGAALSAIGAAAGNWALMAAGPRLGVWGFLAPIVFVVAHRMLPFFTQSAVPGYTAFRPAWAPAAGALLFIAHTALLLADLEAWLWIADVPLAALGVSLLWHWRPHLAYRQPLLWTLFAAFFWLPVALGLSGIQSLWLLATGASVFGSAPLHVLGLGLLTSMVLTMGTRVSLGHSGRPLRMDRVTLACFLTPATCRNRASDRRVRR